FSCGICSARAHGSGKTLFASRDFRQLCSVSSRRCCLLFLFTAENVSFFFFFIVVSCYFLLMPKTILFFFRDPQSVGWEPTWTVQQYYSFVTRFTIGFGLAFELPVVVLALVRFGLITYNFMARTRPYAIVLIFILATIITPTPDILTLIAMGLPMCLLYESCIWIAWFMERRRARSAVG